MSVWVLVADSAEAKLYSAKHLRSQLTLIETFRHEAGRAPARELVTDAPGRVHDRFGPGRHSVEAGQRAKDDEAERFARELAARLDRGLRAGDWKRLVVMAAPGFLGMLRGVLSKSVAAAIIAEVPKDLVAQDPGTVQEHIP